MKLKTTIGEVEVRFYHLREPNVSPERTVAQVRFPGYSRTLSGAAVKSPNDPFSKRIGRKLSLTRALSDGNLSKEQRKMIWEAYQKYTGGY